MPITRFREIFMHMPLSLKLVGIGSALLVISVFLPWYADMDSYGIGDQFLGVTGPASFIGMAILIIGGLSLWIFSFRLRGRKPPRLPAREAVMHIAAAIESLFLLVVVNSIYFHPKFGVNITLKDPKFGMVLAFAAAAMLFMGAYISNREEKQLEESEGRLEPLINIGQERPHQPVSAPTPPRVQTPHRSEQKSGGMIRMDI